MQAIAFTTALELTQLSPPQSSNASWLRYGAMDSYRATRPERSSGRMRPQKPTSEKPMEFQVRPATVNDATAACSVIRSSILECCSDDHRGDATVLEGWLSNKTPDFVRMLVLAPTAFSVVAIASETVVGFGSALRTGELTLCYVAPSVRFTGVGKALLVAIEDHATRAGVEALRLESTRTARAFYLRNGFVPTGSPVSAFGIEGHPMRKRLNSIGYGAPVQKAECGHQRK